MSKNSTSEKLKYSTVSKVTTKGSTALGEALKKAKAGKCNGMYLPKGVSGHVSQYIKAENGLVTLYRHDEQRSKEITEYVKPSNKLPADTLTETRCATEVRHRTDALLAMRGKHPTMRPRPGQEFSMHNAIYHASFADVGNVTGWNDNAPTATADDKADGYIYKAIAQKTASDGLMIDLGFKPEQKDCSGPRYTITRNFQHISKYMCLSRRYPKSAEAYLSKIDSLEKEADTALNRLSHGTYINYKVAAKTSMDKIQHAHEVRTNALCAFAFEPMAPWYTKDHFTLFGLLDLYPLYCGYLETWKKVQVSEAADLQEMILLNPAPDMAKKTLEELTPPRRPKLSRRSSQSPGSIYETPTKALVAQMRRMRISTPDLRPAQRKLDESLIEAKATQRMTRANAGKHPKSGTVVNDGIPRKGYADEYPFVPDQTMDPADLN